MPDSEGKGSFLAFWTTLPGILTGLAAVITAVGSLIAVILVANPGGDEPKQAGPTPTPTLAAPTPAGPLPATPRPGASPGATIVPPGILNAARPIQPGISQAVVGPGQTNYHRIEAPASALVEGDVDTNQTCVRIGLLDQAGGAVFHPGGACSTSEYFSILTSSTAGGVYYLRVDSGSTVAQGAYTVNLRVRSQDDAGTGADVGDQPPDRFGSLAAGRTYQGLVGSHDPVDYYLFQATSNLVLECLYDEFDDVEITLQRVSPFLQVVGEERVPRGGRVDFASRPTGPYLLRISNRGQGAQYTLILAENAGG